MKTPVLLLGFNRPSETRQVAEAIVAAGVESVYFGVDGPREGNERDLDLTAQVREVADYLRVHTVVTTLFRHENLGCAVAVSEAISWFFSEVEEGIILEDDCVPSQDFFPYCTEILDRFRDDPTVMLVSGYNKQGSWTRSGHSYFYSNFGGIWGWATWRRAWEHFDLEMPLLDELVASGCLEDLLGGRLARLREQQFTSAADGQVNTWDFPWAYARNIRSGLAVVPEVNLVRNIGFGPNATHTTGKAVGPTRFGGLRFPLRQNDILIADALYDDLFFPEPSMGQRMRASVARRLPASMKDRLKVMLRGGSRP